MQQCRPILLLSSAAFAAIAAGLFYQSEAPGLLLLSLAVIISSYVGLTAGAMTTLLGVLVALVFQDEQGIFARHSDGSRLAVFVVNGMLSGFLFQIFRPDARRSENAAFTQTDRQRQTEAALAESQIRFSGILESAMDAIISINESQRIVLFNPAAEVMFRCRKEDVIGSHLDRFIPQSLRCAHRQHIERFSETGSTARAMGHLRPLMALRDDGDEFPIEASISQVDIKGRKLFTVILRDITQRQRAEQDLQRAKNVAEAASSAKDQFMAVLSHELRTPLTPVLAALSILKRDQTLSEQNRLILETVKQNIELEARLIDDLLDVTRIIRGKVDLERRPVQLKDMIEKAVAVCGPDFDARRLHFAVSGLSDEWMINGDHARLQQVVWNLIKNAVKFTPNNGCVGVRCLREGDIIAIEVADSGIGIKSEALSRVFNAFEQAEVGLSKRYGGLGLGLTISKAIVEMHGGQITVSSAGENKGTKFRVTLPLSRLAGTGEALRRGSDKEPVDSPSYNPLKILLVEDHRDTARMLGLVLSAGGHEVQTAGDVTTALQLARTNRYDLLISDLGLPDGSGVDLLEELRREGQELPGIALTGFGMEEDVEKTKRAGFAEHIVKPVQAERLESAVHKLTRH